MARERIQKILSQWGIASRRQAEQLIADGRVTVNDRPARLGDKADLERDRLTVDGNPIAPQHRPDLLYVLLNKPPGVVSTCRDPRGRRTVLDLLPAEWREGSGLHPVGRLDADSSGALLLVNDGELTQRLTHPRHHIPKTYRVWVWGFPSDRVLDRWRGGIDLDGTPTQPARVEVIRTDDRKTLLELVLREGRNRQIRRVADALGHEVAALQRTHIGPIALAPPGQRPLPRGRYRLLSARERRLLKCSCREAARPPHRPRGQDERQSTRPASRPTRTLANHRHSAPPSSDRPGHRP